MKRDHVILLLICVAVGLVVIALIIKKIFPRVMSICMEKMMKNCCEKMEKEGKNPMDMCKEMMRKFCDKTESA